MSGPPNPGTKTGRRELARRARRFGYLRGQRPNHLGGTEHTVKVRCPLCRSWVVTPHPRQYENTITRALDAAVIDHLENDCQANQEGNTP